MALKVKSSSLFFYPKVKIKIQLKYSSNYKVGNFTTKARKKDLNTKYRRNGTSRYATNRITGKYFVYNILHSMSKLSSSAVNSHGVRIDNVSMFVKKKNKITHYTILRAPYRYKKGRYQVGYSRSLVTVGLDILIPMHCSGEKSLKSLKQLTSLLPLVLGVFSSTSTNIITLNKIRLLLPLRSSNLFRLTNYTIY